MDNPLDIYWGFMGDGSCDHNNTYILICLAPERIEQFKKGV